MIDELMCGNSWVNDFEMNILKRLYSMYRGASDTLLEVLTEIRPILASPKYHTNASDSRAS